MADTRFIKDDSRWVRQMFMIDPNSLDTFLKSKRTASTDFYKFVDTTPGGNFAINPPPQFTRYADLKGERAMSSLSRGMGRYYSEAIDDNQRLVHMRFGVPAYTGLLQFFTNFYNSDAARVAKTGNSGGVFYNVGKLIGYVAVLPFTPFILVGSALRFLSGTPSTKFCYLKPTMPIYWNAVTTMLNGIAANMGLVPNQENDEIMVPRRDAAGKPLTDANNNVIYDPINLTLDKPQLEEYTKLLPDIFRKGGGIDVYSVSTRAQRLANIWNERLGEISADVGTISDSTWRDRIISYAGKTHSEMVQVLEGTPLKVALERWFSTTPGKDLPSNTADTNAVSNEYFKDQQAVNSSSNYLKAELRDGAQFVSFNIQSTGTASESWSSSTKESDIGSKFNSLSSGVRQAKINFADGNTGIAPLDAAAKAAGDVVSGILDGVQMSGLIALAGNALTDIPKIWDSSTVSLPRCDYTIQLRTPYGNKMSRFLNLLMPLSMLLAGAMPRSTGSQSYTSPFLMEIYDKGRAQSRLAIIESLSVTRGVGNIGWTQDGEPLGIDVTLSVADLSSIMHMPLGTASTTLSPGGINRAFFGDDTAYSDYIAVLSSLGLADQIYKTRRLARNWRKLKLDFDSFFSTSHAISWAVGTLPGRVISGLSNIRTNS